MTKYIIMIVLTLALQPVAHAQYSNEFEAELMMLENPDGITNDLGMQKVIDIEKDKEISNLLDTVSTNQASTTTADLEATKTQTISPSKKVRRIPSR